MLIMQEIEQSLRAQFHPTRLEVLDESEQHRGHAGHKEGGESHFRVRIAATDFAPMTRLERHRAIHAALGAGLIGRIHALAIEISE
jgi:BolA family transcriptional regulator, general stress-responsive regulator